MSVRNLRYLFEPASVAVIGASNRPHSVGRAVMRNLLAGGFAGPVMPVNPRHQSVAGVLAYASVEELPETPELAVICTPPATVPALVGALGERGTRAAVVLTAGLAATRTDDGRTIEQAMLDAARPHLLRILGPNCLGLIAPGSGPSARAAMVDSPTACATVAPACSSGPSLRARRSRSTGPVSPTTSSTSTTWARGRTACVGSACTRPVVRSTL